MHKKFFSLVSLFIALFINCNTRNNHYDAAIVGLLNFQCSISRLPVVWIDCINHNLKTNFINSRPHTHKVNFQDLPPNVLNLIKQSQTNCKANVTIFLDLLWDKSCDRTLNMPTSLIKIAYSMLESTAIPKEWVDILNNNFDAVAVPDKFLIPVYKSSGVNKPIFELPIGLYLKDFFKQPRKKKNKQTFPFTFGSSAAFVERKNIDLLVEAFIKEFKNNKKFRLIIHGRYSGDQSLNKVKQKLQQYKPSNIKIILERFSQEKYVKFMSSLNCYVLISKGEGFSISPYEALALGIPCILTNNTAHSTICKTGFVKGIKTPIAQPAFYLPFNKYCGHQLTCSVQSVQKALREVYDKYNYYLDLANKAKSWVAKYDISNLKPFYLSLVNPKKVFLGSINVIHPDYIITSDKNLYEKYQTLISLRQFKTK